MSHLELLSRLARKTDGRIVLLVLDGVGDLRTSDQPRTPLERAPIPNLDALARRSALGRIVPVASGITPGSGPGHLALFGYDPTAPETDIGRGVLEALGLGLEIQAGTVAARGNFATVDGEGRLTDRRAGRISTQECRRLCGKLRDALTDVEEVETRVEAGEGHRFVLLLHGEGLSPELADTDPQRTGVPSLPPRARTGAAEATAGLVQRLLDRMLDALADESPANHVLLRGFSAMPDLPPLEKLYRLRCGAFAGYPLYRGVAAACGMEVVECGTAFDEVVEAVSDRWSDFDYFFIHFKKTDMAGEDGDFAAKVDALQEADRHVRRLLELEPEVLAVTGDHSTPVPMRGHSWHPVPLLVHSPRCFVDDTTAFDEIQAASGHLGTIPSRELMGLLLANAGRLKKFGA